MRRIAICLCLENSTHDIADGPIAAKGHHDLVGLGGRSCKLGRVAGALGRNPLECWS